MNDQRAIKEIINQMDILEKNNSSNIEYITSINLMLTSENNGTVKDPALFGKFKKLKDTIEEASNLSKEFTNILKSSNTQN